MSGTPIAAPSANISSKPSGTNVDDIFNELKDKVDCIIDGGQCNIGVESTVVRVIEGIPHILRPGKITPEEIKKVTGQVVIGNHILQKIGGDDKVLSPGMIYRHYAPNSNCILVYSKDTEKIINNTLKIASEYKNPLIVCSYENVPKYNIKNVVGIFHQGNFEELLKKIFHALRKVDSYSPDIVVIEGIDKEGLVLAIMNRLIRACAYNYIEIE